MSAAPTITLTRDGRAVLAFPFDRFLVEALKDGIPAHARSYDPVVKSWTIAPAYAGVATLLMLATFPDVEIVEHAQPGSADRGPRAGDDPWRILHLRPTAPPELIVAAHKCLARLHHPDTGGDTATMQAINAAAEALRETGR